jgi:hypothetical protein
MKFFVRLILTLLVISLVGGATAQTTTSARVKRSEEILKKIRETELLNQILPVLMTKEQIRKIIPEIEKAREVVRQTEAAELEVLKKLEPEVDAVLKDGYGKSKVPTREFFDQYDKEFKKMRVVRTQIILINSGKVMAVAKEVLNKGQLEAARKALSPTIFEADKDPKTLTDDEKLLMWVRVVLLDPQSYDILIKLSK